MSAKITVVGVQIFGVHLAPIATRKLINPVYPRIDIDKPTDDAVNYPHPCTRTDPIQPKYGWIYEFPSSDWRKMNPEYLHTDDCYFCSYA